MIYELNPEKIIYPYLVKVRADSARKTIRRLTLTISYQAVKAALADPIDSLRYE